MCSLVSRPAPFLCDRKWRRSGNEANKSIQRASYVGTGKEDVFFLDMADCYKPQTQAFHADFFTAVKSAWKAWV